jgi:putative addiction module CopG family antidote
MGILSVSLTPELEKFIEDEVASGEFESKGQVIKRALKKLQEDLIVEDLLRISAEIEDGVYFEGDLDELAKKIK